MASAGWERRNASARAKGYRSYYDYRAHAYGKIPAGQPRASGDALRQLRGHAAVSDFERLLYSGRVEQVNVIQTGDNRFELLAVDSSGKQHTFTIRGRKQVERLQAILRRDDIPGGGPEGPRIIGSPKAIAAMNAELAAEQAEAEAEAAGDEPYAYTEEDIPF